MSNFSSQNSVSEESLSPIPEPIPSPEMTPEEARAWLDANLEWAMQSDDDDEIEDEEYDDE